MISSDPTTVLEKSLGLVDYVLAVGDQLPPIQAGMFEYVCGADGIYVRARRDALEVLIPTTRCELRFLEKVKPYVRLTYERVPARIISEMLSLSRDAARNSLEKLFYLLWEDNRWRLVVPDQVQNEWSVEPVEKGDGSAYSQAIIEVHSHRFESAHFSSEDDRGEHQLRIYAVIGRVFNDRAEIRLRVAVYGYTYEIPAHLIMELPGDVRDCLEGIEI